MFWIFYPSPTAASSCSRRDCRRPPCCGRNRQGHPVPHAGHHAELRPGCGTNFSRPEATSRLPIFQRLHDFLQNGLDNEAKNLDDLINEAAAQFPQDNFIRVFRFYVENYKIYYVLNKFNSVAESVEDTIKPLVEKIFRTVSSRVSFHNLGWMVENEEIKKSSETGVPYLVRRHYQKKQAPAQALDLDASLRAMFGLEKKQAPGQAEKKQALARRTEQPDRPAAQDLPLQRRQGSGNQPEFHRRPGQRKFRPIPTTSSA